jgi:acetyl esterase/lipase
MSRAYVPQGDLKAPLASPLFADLKGLPPLLIHVGSNETLFDDSTRFDAAARSAGVDVTFEAWNGQVHVFQMFAWLVPESKEAIAKIGAFMKEQTAARS